MGNPMSSYWKRREPHKQQIEYVDDRILIRPMVDVPLVEKTHIYEGCIIPNRVIKGRNVYEIIEIGPQYYINGFSVTTEQDKVQLVTLFGYHPNRDPKTNLYCIPDYKKGVIFDQIYLDRLITNIKTYYLDNCYFIPRSVKYRKLKSIAIQFNEGG
jgi:hypothetical protein